MYVTYTRVNVSVCVCVWRVEVIFLSVKSIFTNCILFTLQNILTNKHSSFIINQKVF